MWEIGVIAVALVVIFCTNWMIRKWRPQPKSNGVLLPPGSMGLPFIGETLQLFFPSYSLDLHPFLKKRIQRFGPIFRTSLVGHPVVVSADPELNNYIFKHEGTMVEMHYMGIFSKIFTQKGESKMNEAGKIHKYIRNIALSHFGSEKIKERLLPEIENLVNETLLRWSGQESVELKHSSSAMIFEFIAKKLYGCNAKNSSKNISDKFVRMLDGLMSFPLNVPGTNFYRCLKDKEEVVNILKDIIKERRTSPEIQYEDFLDQAIAELNTEDFLTEDFIVLLLFAILFAGFQTTSTVITLAIKLLLEHPSVMQELIAEHEALLKRRQNPDSSLTWDEYKSMTFTLHVINESLRLGNAGHGLLRRALKDIHIKGYTIPAGWTIMIATSALHMNPTMYNNPLAFNPWHWKDLEGHVISKNLMPFGGGTRQCAGAELAKAFMATFLHVLVTKYRWRKIKGGKCVRNPNLKFGDGLHIKFFEKHT